MKNPLNDKQSQNDNGESVKKDKKIRVGEKYSKGNMKEPVAYVCLGGSAGSVEPIRSFFQDMPVDTGLAFIVIQHLNPNHKSMMPDLVKNWSKMPSKEVEDGLKALPNYIYLIPPNKEMTIYNGAFQLSEPPKPRGLRMPIDTFMESLAKDQEEKAIGIILSGLDSDGVKGAKFIKANLGMIMAQSPESSLYDDMPTHAIQRDYVDFIGTPEELRAKLLLYIQKSKKLIVPKGEKEASESFNNSLHKIFILLRNQTGHDFSLYKRNTIHRRIERRMNTHQLEDIKSYVKLLQENPHEIELLFKELLIGVTKFFRDPEAFNVLKQEIIPKIIKEKDPSESLRVWCTGVSTGEEVYSIAMVILESLAEMGPMNKIPIQIFATDLDQEAIDRARAGYYLSNISADISIERLNRFFLKDGDRYLIKKEVRELIVFATHNLTKDAPFTKLDLLCCRNLLIYLSPELQKKLMPVFHFSLNPKGYLFLGPSESLGPYSELFSAVNLKWKIFNRKMGESLKMLEFPISFSKRDHKGKLTKNETKAEKGTSLGEFVNKQLLEYFTPPAVIVNSKGDILYIHGRTGKFLEPSAGNANMNITAMAREGLKFEINSAIFKSISQKGNIFIEKLRVKTNGHYQLINLEIRYILEPVQYKGLLMVVFREFENGEEVEGIENQIEEASKSDTMIAHMEKELDYTKQQLQTTLEEMESSFEELKSANEELQSTNEELQSINEESISSKEEMQSLNEELMAINIEYQSKTDELTQMNNDMKNLLDSTEIATIFIDSKLRIKRYTPAATKVANLIDADIGRPLSHIVSNLKYNDLIKDVQEVMDKLAPKERNVQAENNDWYNMRLFPYRTLSNYIDGVVLTFTDISKAKKLEEELQESLSYCQMIIDSVSDAIIVVNQNLEIVNISKSFQYKYKTITTSIGQSIFDLNVKIFDEPELKAMLQRLIKKDSLKEEIVVNTMQSIEPGTKINIEGKVLKLTTEARKLILLTFKEVDH